MVVEASERKEQKATFNNKLCALFKNLLTSEKKLMNLTIIMKLNIKHYG